MEASQALFRPSIGLRERERESFAKAYSLSFLPLSRCQQQQQQQQRILPLKWRLVKASSSTDAPTKPPKSPAEEDWKVKREYLQRNNVRSIDAKTAYNLQQKEGHMILDIRPVGEFTEAHPTGAINVQVYRLIKEWTAWDIARRLAFAFFGIFAGTEENPEFLNEVASFVDKDAKIIVACVAGGTMKPSATLADGQQSRSLIAAYLLKLNGYKNVLHLEGGIRSWIKEGLPIEE